MIQPKKRNILSKNDGFLLAEAVFSVFVTLLVVLILQDLMKSITIANRAGHRTDDIVFAYVQFNRFLKADSTKVAYTDPDSSNHQKAVLVKVDSNNQKNVYALTHYKRMIRVTTPEGGHMPLLLNVRKAIFATKGCQIRINVTERDGRSSEIYFKLDPKPKKKKENESKK